MSTERYGETWSDMCESNDELDRPIRKEREREIKIDIFEEHNEKKFDKLTREEKLKSPFKRRLSSEKSDTSKLLNTDLKRTKTELAVDDVDKSEERRGERSRQESVSSSSSGRKEKKGNQSKREIETDVATLSRREKQIEFGKNTIGYDNYIRLVPKESRTRDHPSTPDKNMKYSRRAWDGLIKIWRKGLHVYDSQSNEKGDSDEGLNGVQKELEELVDSV